MPPPSSPGGPPRGALGCAGARGAPDGPCTPCRGRRAVREPPAERRTMPDELAQPPMTTALEVDYRHARLVVTGEVDLLTAPDFISALGAAQEAAPDVVVDLTEVRFMDSTGL